MLWRVEMNDGIPLHYSIFTPQRTIDIGSNESFMLLSSVNKGGAPHFEGKVFAFRDNMLDHKTGIKDLSRLEIWHLTKR